MSENIRVSEVSDILRKQLEGINANVQLDEIGTVLQVSDGVVRILSLIHNLTLPTICSV